MSKKTSRAGQMVHHPLARIVVHCLAVCVLTAVRRGGLRSMSALGSADCCHWRSAEVGPAK